jgi:hypothetical protein
MEHGTRKTKFVYLLLYLVAVHQIGIQPIGIYTSTFYTVDLSEEELNNVSASSKPRCGKH